MLEEELFPVSEFKKYWARRRQITNRDFPHRLQFIRHVQIRQSITLSDTAPILGWFFEQPEDQRYINSLYNQSSAAEVRAFECSLQKCLQTIDNDWNFHAMMLLCPHVRNRCEPTRPIRQSTIRHAIRANTLLEHIHPYIAAGTYTNTLKLRDQANPTGAAPQNDFNELMQTLLLHAEKTAAGIPSALAFRALPYTTTTDYFAILEGCIKEGVFDWSPTVDTCLTLLDGDGWYVSGYRNWGGEGEFQPGRLIKLLEWIMDERVRREAEQKRRCRGEKLERDRRKKEAERERREKRKMEAPRGGAKVERKRKARVLPIDEDYCRKLRKRS
ncbi:hypothetical protein HDV00_010050 [Rhizophlyctis rosea]|nr:hypothetical protein HDV00_010050 [Rhizophlyctis rosea]